jgi:hypothetical protein
MLEPIQTSNIQKTDEAAMTNFDQTKEILASII